MTIRKRKGLGKKGSLQDIMFVIGLILFFAVVVLIGFRVASAYNDNIQGMSIIPQDAKDASTSLTGNYTGIVDNMFLVLTIGLCLVALILAAMVRVHPIFIPIFFIVEIITIFVAGIASDIYQTIAANSNLVDYSNQLVIISTVLGYLPLFIGIFGIILMVVMYKLWSMDQ
mgnify:CR=1 FL=1